MQVNEVKPISSNHSYIIKKDSLLATSLLNYRLAKVNRTRIEANS
jgi:hypothetical protein